MTLTIFVCHVCFLFCLKQGFRISSQLLSFFNEVRFSGVIDPKLNLNREKKVFLKKVNVLGFIDQIYKSVKDCMTHHKVIVLNKKKKFLIKFIYFEPFHKNFFVFKFDKVVMGHAILTKLILWFN